MFDINILTIEDIKGLLQDGYTLLELSELFEMDVSTLSEA